MKSTWLRRIRLAAQQLAPRITPAPRNTANSGGFVNGGTVAAIDFRANANTALASIFDQTGGLHLYAACNAGGGPLIYAYTDSDHAAIRAWGLNVSVAGYDFRNGVGGFLINGDGSGNSVSDSFLTVVYSTHDAAHHVVVSLSVAHEAFGGAGNGGWDCSVWGNAVYS